MNSYLKQKGVSNILPKYVYDAAEQYSWPGNVRELFNFLDRYLAFGDTALESIGYSTPFTYAKHSQGESLKEALNNFELDLFMRALQKHKNNHLAAAQELRVNVRTFNRRLKVLSAEKNNTVADDA